MNKDVKKNEEKKKIEESANKIINKHINAFKELAK
jgi:hypothetical protein